MLKVGDKIRAYEDRSYGMTYDMETAAREKEIGEVVQVVSSDKVHIKFPSCDCDYVYSHKLALKHKIGKTVRNLQPGDKVKITHKGDFDWVSDMSAFVGKTVTIDSERGSRKGDTITAYKIVGSTYTFYSDSMELVDEPEKVEKTAELSAPVESKEKVKEKPLMKIPAYAVVNMETGALVSLESQRDEARNVLREFKSYWPQQQYKIVKLKADKFVR